MGKLRKKLINYFILFYRISNKGDDTQSVNTVKSSEDGLFVKRLRSLFPAIEIKIEHVSLSFFISFFAYVLFLGSNICWT
jgi:hypothetical protein